MSTIMRDTGKSKTCVWRRQGRLADEGFEGMLRDKRRASRIPKLAPRSPSASSPSIRQLKLSRDPEFADNLRDVLGLYVDPPAHAAVPSVHEKSQLQALNRTQPGPPIRKGPPRNDDP